MVKETNRRDFLTGIVLGTLASSRYVHSQNTEAENLQRKVEYLIQQLPYRTAVKLQEVLKDKEAYDEMQRFLPFDKVRTIYDRELRESMYELFVEAYKYHAGSSQNEVDQIHRLYLAASAVFIHYERYQILIGERGSMAIRPEITRLFKFALDRIDFMPERASRIQYLRESYSNLLKDYEILKSNRPIPRADEGISRK